MDQLTQTLLVTFDEQISLFSAVDNSELAQVVIQYYTSMKQFVLYINNNLHNLDKTIVNEHKQMIIKVMNKLLDMSSSQSDIIYLEMADMTKETYQNVNMLCEVIMNER